MSTTHPSVAISATVDDLCSRLAALPREDSTALCAFARIFFAKVPPALLAERSADQLAGMTVGAWEFLQRSRPEAATGRSSWTPSANT